MKKTSFFLLLFLIITGLFGQTPSLVYPKDSVVLGNNTIDLNWNKISDAQYYIIQIDTNLIASPPFLYDSLSSNDTVLILPDINKVYKWRIRAKTSSGYTFWSEYYTFTYYNPLNETDLVLWLCADSLVTLSGNNVTQWPDISGNGNHAAQSNTLFQPLFVASDDSISGHSAIYFDGLNDVLNGSTIANLNNTSISFFSVVSGDTISNSKNDGIFTVNNYTDGFWIERRSFGVNAMMYANNSSTYIQTSPNSLPKNGFNYKVLTVVKNYGTDVKLLLNNQVNITSSDATLCGPFTNGIYKIGYALNYYAGRMAEQILFQAAISDSLKDIINQYLMDKYAPPVNLGADTIIEKNQLSFFLIVGSYFDSQIWSDLSTNDSLIVSNSGQYFVEATDVFGRSSTDTILICKSHTNLLDTFFCASTFNPFYIKTNLSSAFATEWSDGNTSDSLLISSEGLYWVEIVDTAISQCVIRDYFQVAIDSFAFTASLGPDTSLCTGDLFSLQSEVGNGYSYNWSTGSSDSAIVISTADTYYLTVTNNNSCIAVDTVNIAIKGVKPVAVFSNGTVCLGDSTNFVDMSYTLAPDGINNILYDFNDGDSSTVSNPYHAFASAGDFMVTLEVFSDSGCYADTSLSVHVRDLPSADFLPFNGCNGKLINFSDSSDEAEGSIALWEWNFGDGNISSQQNPTHTYDSVDIYNTTLIISDIYGCSDTVIYPVNIRLTPIADFDYDESCLGQKTYFTELTNMPTYSPIIYRKWEFGDGNYSLLQNPQHTYDAIGTYNVLLINKSINGCIDSVQKSIIVHPFPTAGFISDTACKNRIVCFTDTSSVLYSSIVSREWDFDVAGTNTGDSIACTSFPDEGVFSVQLIVTSEYGCSAIANEKITVHPNPIADFSVIPEYGVPPLDVQFYNYTSGADSWYWLFGDGGISTLEHPAYTYNSESVFNVMLVAENEFTCTDTAYGNIYVIPSTLDLVLNSIAVTDSNGYLYLTIEFYNNGTRNIRDIALDARIGSNLPVRESWSGLLLPGEQSSYSFTAAFLKPETENIRTICVEGTVLDSYGQEDEKPEDNTICYSLLDEFFIASIYPSPADENITINISIPDNGDLSLFISSEDGKIVREGVYSDLDEGTLRVRIDVENLAGGVYVIHAQYKDKEDSVKFVKE